MSIMWWIYHLWVIVFQISALACYAVGSPDTESHSWNTMNTFNIRAKARDTNGAESSWSEHSVTIPRNKAINKPFLNFLDNHPNIFPLLRLMLQKLGL